jgi:hypothetical protein
MTIRRSCPSIYHQIWCQKHECVCCFIILEHNGVTNSSESIFLKWKSGEFRAVLIGCSITLLIPTLPHGFSSIDELFSGKIKRKNRFSQFELQENSTNHKIAKIGQSKLNLGYFLRYLSRNASEKKSNPREWKTQKNPRQPGG